MQYAYAYQLNGSQTSGLDPDAKAYINAVVGTGAMVTSTQRNAINNFYKTGKKDGWYSQLKRIYLPIWAAADPNAIDMVSRASGSFAGGVTHSSGYATGNGTTGVFNYNTNANAQGLSASTGCAFWLAYTGATTGVQVGAMQGVTNRCSLFSTSSSSVGSELTSSATSVTATVAGANLNLGISLSTRTSTTSHKIFHRRSSFLQRGATNTTAETLAAPNAMQCAWARGRDGTTRDNFSNAGLGAHGIGLGMTDLQAENFTLALKTLWETSTGLVLP